jgi:cellulose synthase/poly-beta-1,6-N-acetylglucosamine synthase-like glycosyltransferase
MASTDQFTIIVPTCGRPVELERCLRAIAALEGGGFHVLVVDNRPGGTETRDVVLRFGAEYLAAPVKGANRARNLAALASRTALLAYLDDDAVPDPSWLRELALEFDDPSVMVVTGRVLPLSVETDAARLAIAVGASVFDQPKRVVLDRSAPDWFERSAFGGVGIGCNMAFRRSAFDVWAGFHPAMDRGTPVYGHGENHAFFSLVAQGYRAVYTPKAIVRHPLPESLAALRRDNVRDAAAFTAYVTLLLVEHPEQRAATLRFAREAFSGKSREWRWVPKTTERVIPRWRRLLSLAQGPMHYYQARRQARALDARGETFRR